MKKESIIYLKLIDRESQHKILTLLLNLFNVNFLAMRHESPEIQQPLHKTFLSNEPVKLWFYINIFVEEVYKTEKYLNTIIWRKLQPIEHLHDECPPVFSTLEPHGTGW